MQIIRNTGNVSFLTDDGDIYKIVFPNAIIDVIDSQFLQVKFGQELMRINAEDVTATKTLSGVLTAFSGNAYDLAIILQDIFFFDVAGGGGASDLETVLGIGSNTGPNNIDINTGSAIRFDNGSSIKEGTIDAGLGGYKGVSLICAVGYELKWEAGRLYVMDGNGVYIRWSLYNFNVTPTVSDDVTKGYLPGSRWSIDDGTVYVCTDSTTGAAVWELEVNGIATILKTKVVNKTTPAVTLTKADYQVCLISGAQGQRLAVRLAKGDNDANSAGTLGIASETILINQEGFITSVGLIEDINTTGSLQGETWADGDILYLSPTTFGAITNIKPVAPDHTVIVGYVEYAHAIQGKIYVKIDNGYELDELHNVKITNGTLANNNVLTYTSATQIWENKPLPAEIQVACSDETTAITAGANKVTFRMPHAMTVTSVRASLTTAQTSGSIFTVDINEGGTSILSTKLTIDNTEKTSTTAATAPVISDTALDNDAEITIDVDQIGDGTAKGLKVTIIGTRV